MYLFPDHCFFMLVSKYTLAVYPVPGVLKKCIDVFKTILCVNWRELAKPNPPIVIVLSENIHRRIIPTCIITVLVNGGWGDWASLTECSQSCGGGSQTFQRECDNAIPAYGGNTCVRNKQETRTCNTKDCPGICFYISMGTRSSFISW